MRNEFLLLFIILLVSLVPAAGALVITSPSQVIVNTTFVSSEAGYNNEFGLYQPFQMFLGKGHDTPPGTVFNIGVFNPGDNLIFYIKTNEANPKTYLSEGVMADGIVHGKVIDLGGGLYNIKFEDLWGGGDRDYNDIILQVSIAPKPPVGVPVPEFATPLMPVSLLAGLVCILYLIRTRNS